MPDSTKARLGLLGGIEAGGTKMLCAIARDPHTILHRCLIPTEGPAETLAAIRAFFAEGQKRFGPLAGLGIASFGPLILDPAAADFGAIARTPKPGWSGVNLRRDLGAALGCPVAIDTDVNAAALAESALGAGRGAASLIYATIGTGIGGGLVVDGVARHGLGHPEMGHMRPIRHAADAGFAGCCPFHGDCLEGLACGPAIVARTGHPLVELPADHPVRAVIADYLGQFCATLVLLVAPHRIVLGGGVMQGCPALFTPILAATRRWLGGYAAAADDLIVPPALGADAGLCGALLLAERCAGHAGA